MSFTRESVYAALAASLANLVGIKTVSRRLKHWADVPRDEQPYLGISQARETSEGAIGAPMKWKWQLDLYLYTNSQTDETAATNLNAALDSVCNALNALNPVTGRNTLGLPLDVQYCRVDGSIETDEGTLGQQSVAIIPVTIFIIQSH